MRSVDQCYGGDFVAELFSRQGITYQPTPKPKSDLYLDFMARITSGQVELLDNDTLVAQLSRLERRAARGGRDSIDHPIGEHDDLANAVAGVASMDHSRIEMIFGGYSGGLLDRYR